MSASLHNLRSGGGWYKEFGTKIGKLLRTCKDCRLYDPPVELRGERCRPRCVKPISSSPPLHSAEEKKLPCRDVISVTALSEERGFYVLQTKCIKIDELRCRRLMGTKTISGPFQTRYIQRKVECLQTFRQRE